MSTLVIRNLAAPVVIPKRDPLVLRPMYGTVSVSLAGGGYDFIQASPSDEWIMNHNLGYYPSISLFTVGGVDMLGQIVNIDLNQSRAYFINPVAGRARLS